MRSEREIEEVIGLYADMVKKVCFVYVKNHSDTEDIFQDVFLKYALFSRPFESEEHRKAWLIRVTVNRCKDVLKSFFKSRVCSLEEIRETVEQEEAGHSEVLEAVLSLPEKYKAVVYLHYYEGYTAAQIGTILGKNENTVYTHLTRARQQLKEILGGEGLG